MKKYFLICLLMLGAVCNLSAGPRRCTEQDIPMDIRPTYIQQARQMLEAYYSQLPLCIGEPMVKEAFITNFMQADKSAYKPEFLPTAKYDAMLEPQQYLQELDKLALKLSEGELTFIPQNFRINAKDFYAPNMVSCYIRVLYQLLIELDGKKLASRECEAYCLFPRAAVSINVKLMQVDVTKGEDYKMGQKPVEVDREATVVPTSTPSLSSIDKGADVQSLNESTKENKVGFFYGLFHPSDGMRIVLYVFLGLAVVWLIFEGFIGELKSPWVWLYSIGGAIALYVGTYLIHYLDHHVSEETTSMIVAVLGMIIFGSGTVFGFIEKMWRDDYGKWNWSNAGTLFVLLSFTILSTWWFIHCLLNG